MPCVHNTCAPAARDDASDSSADLPAPGSPRTTTTAPRPAAASANKASSRALSKARPQSTRPRYPSAVGLFPRADPRGDGVRRFAVARVAVQIRGGSAIFDPLTAGFVGSAGLTNALLGGLGTWWARASR